MRIRPRRSVPNATVTPLAVVASCLLLAGAPGLVSAQGLIARQPRAGELGVSFIGLWRGGGGRTGSLDRNFRQWLKLPLHGAIVHRHVLRYQLSLRPTFRQSLSPGVPSAITSREFGFDFGADVLSGMPVSLALTANRSSGSTSGGFGSEGDFSTSNLGAVMNFRVPALPARFSYFSRSSENVWFADPDATPTAWSNSTRTLRFVAENSKLRLSAERLLFNDRLGPDDFAVWAYSASHRFRWGKGSHIQSTFDRTDRSGTTPYVRQTWREQLQIQHTRATNTKFGFQKHSSETPVGTSRATTLNLVFTSRVQHWLSLGLRGSMRSSRFRLNREKVLAGGPTLGLRASLPFGVRFMANGMFGYERRTREFGEDAVFEVIDDRHVIDETRSFFLDQPGIDTATVSLRSQDQMIEYIRNVDYRVLALDGVVEIIVIPGSRIQVGDAVLASYRFLPPEPPSGRLLIGRYNISLSTRGFSVRYSRVLRESEERSAAAVVGLGTLDETSIDLMGAIRLPIGRWDLDLRRIGRTSSALNFTAYQGSTSLGFEAWRSTNWNVGLSARHSRQEGRSLTSRALYVSVNWNVRRLARITGRIQAWDLMLDGADADRSVGGHLDVNLRIAAINVGLQYVYNIRTLPSTVTRHRLSLRLVRRF